MNLFALVKAGTTALGTDPVRFFEFGTAPTLEQTPYATWQEITINPFHTFDRQALPTDLVKVQIDVWAGTTAEVRAITRQIRLAIAPHVDVVFAQFTWDQASNLYRSITHVTYAQEL